MAQGKKNARRMGAHIVFIDESGFMLIPTVRKTWSPRGHTPVLHHKTWPRHRISVISGVTISPLAHRMGLYFALHRTNIAKEQVVGFVRQLLRHLRGPIILLWDNSRTHQGPLLRSVLEANPRLQVEYFPPYAPELNPDEGVWSHSKRELANGHPLTVDNLQADILDSLERLRSSQAALRACVHRSDLNFF